MAAVTSSGTRDGRSTRWDPHRRRRRAAIIDAAIAAIEQYGPDALTAQVAQMAGVPRTHVYRHFEGKHALDLAVSRHLAREIGESIRAGLSASGSARGIIGGAIDHHLGWVEAHPNLYRFLAQHAYAVNATGTPAVDDAKAALAKELTAVLAGYMQAFGIDDAPAERVIVGVVGLVDTTAAWWLEHREISREELATELTEQVWLIIDHTSRGLGLTLDPTAELPPLGDPDARGTG
jgi:AcrR family transcriptional regulator